MTNERHSRKMNDLVDAMRRHTASEEQELQRAITELGRGLARDAGPGTRLQSRGWAVFAPSGAVSWRSFETSREASIQAFCGEHWRDAWPVHEKAGYRCLRLRFAPDPS